MSRRKTCHECGSKIKKTWNFCSKCGTKVDHSQKEIKPIPLDVETFLKVLILTEICSKLEYDTPVQHHFPVFDPFHEISGNRIPFEPFPSFHPIIPLSDLRLNHSCMGPYSLL